MITAIVYDGYAEVRITGDHHAEFDQDLDYFKSLIDEKHRKYFSHKKVWTVKELENYTKVPFIRAALLDRQKQLDLFG